MIEKKTSSLIFGIAILVVILVIANGLRTVETEQTPIINESYEGEYKCLNHDLYSWDDSEQDYTLFQACTNSCTIMAGNIIC